MISGKIAHLLEAPAPGKVRLFEGEPDVMSVPKGANLLGVSPDTLRREIARGKLECSHVGACVRITKTQLLRYLGEEVGNAE